MTILQTFLMKPIKKVLNFAVVYNICLHEVWSIVLNWIIPLRSDFLPKGEGILM